jgi:hypothetical protein
MMITAALTMDPSNEAPLIALLIVAVTVGAIMILRPLIGALSRRLEGRVGDPGLVQRVRELEGRVADLESQAGRTTELEERLDFAERMLTDARRKEQLPG